MDLVVQVSFKRKTLIHFLFCKLVDKQLPKSDYRHWIYSVVVLMVKFWFNDQHIYMYSLHIVHLKWQKSSGWVTNCLQAGLGVPLEMVHGSGRVATIYISGVSFISRPTYTLRVSFIFSPPYTLYISGVGFRCIVHICTTHLKPTPDMYMVV